MEKQLQEQSPAQDFELYQRRFDADGSQPFFLDDTRLETFGNPDMLLHRKPAQVDNNTGFQYETLKAKAPVAPVYEIPEENKLSTLGKFCVYTASAVAFWGLGSRGMAVLTRNPWLQLGAGAVTMAGGLKHAEYSIKGQELKDLVVKQSIALPEKK